MSFITGGVFSKPRGKTGGVVFGAARSRTGKVTTCRALVPPSNPNTAAQQVQRGKFSQCQDIVRRLGPTIYQSDFNRSIGQLPGFQSLNSILLNQMDSSEDLTLTTPVNLGVLHYPSSPVTFTPDVAECTINFTTENGTNGTANDKFVALLIAQTSVSRAYLPTNIQSAEVVRSAGAVTFTGLVTNTNYQVYCYVRGVGLAAGLLSVANFGSFVTS